MSVSFLPTAKVNAQDVKKIVASSLEQDKVKHVIILSIHEDETFSFSASDMQANDCWWVLTRAIAWFKKNYVGC